MSPSKTNSPTSNKPIENAEEVIELFGGIRPMAAKLNVAATTVQGWKERNTIPGARRAQILALAKESDIAIAALLGGAVSLGTSTKPEAKAASAPKATTQSAGDEKPQRQPSNDDLIQPGGAVSSAKKVNPKKPSGSVSQSPSMTTQQQLEAMNKKAVKRNMMFTGSLVAVALVASFFFFSREDVARVEQDLSQFERDTTSNFDQLRQEAQVLTSRVNDIAGQVSGIVAKLGDESAGSLMDRIAALESQLSNASTTESIQGLMQRIESMSASVGGQQELGIALQQLSGAVQGMQGEMDEMDNAIEEAKVNHAVLSQTLDGISGSDLGAAAMLMALGHARNSFGRENVPFEEDLAVIRNVIGPQDPELNAAIDRLAPYAADGVLSTETLSNELAALSGDIAMAKMQGQDLSIQDQALQRFNDVVTLSKNGEQITGVEKDEVVSRAQALLDEGDVKGAMAELSKLEGEAAQVAEPWMQKAEGNVAAQNLEAAILEEVLKQVQNLGSSGLFNSGGNHFSFGQ